MPTTTTTTTMDDYERRFQRSLQKLTIPTWYTDTIPSSNISSSSKQSIISTELTPWKTRSREPERTPEITHIRRPHSYRSCRSSIATSPSPSIHSWHPNHMMDGANFSLATPSSSSSRRYHKYQKGIERVSKSSRWYQPTPLVANQTGIIKTQTPQKNNHYDTPKIYNEDENIVAKSNDNMEKNIINDKQQDNHIKSNESQIMPLAKEELFSQIELVEITDEDDDKQIDHNKLLERTANDLVEIVLADVLVLKNLTNQDNNDDDDDHDRNSGVRELSEDENGLRELDENDMNNTDEFIVFATNPDISNDDQTSDSPRYSLNRLYTFSKANEHQNLPKAILEEPFENFFYTSPIYYPNCDGVNEETARIGRLLLDSIPIVHSQTPTPNQLIISEQEYDEELYDRVRRDSAYSSAQERINIPQTVYEPLSECYSGYSLIQSDFLTPNVSTTDEAYESEPTTMCSSIATTTHVHPDLEHEFEYPSPPPPVPDRRLKPTYLKPLAPPTKPRLSKQNNLDSTDYSIIQKTKPLPISSIQQFVTSTSNDSTSPSTKTMSSRHYCGTNELTKSSPIKIKEKRNSRTTLNCLHPSTTDDNHKRNSVTKSSLSLNKSKTKKQKLVTDFDEATNGLAIRLPAPVSNKQNLNRTSTPLSTKRANVNTSNRPTIYETSV